jgi:hypothetical protein
MASTATREAGEAWNKPTILSPHASCPSGLALSQVRVLSVKELERSAFTFEYLPCGRFWDRCLHILKISPNIIACKRLSA